MLKFEYHCGRQYDPSMNMANAHSGLGYRYADVEFMSHSDLLPHDYPAALVKQAVNPLLPETVET